MLQELNFRKQLPVYVQYAHVNTTKDKKFVYELLDSGLSHEDAKIEFVPADSTSMDEQNVLVYRIIKRIQMFKKKPSLFVGSRSSNKSHLQQQNVLNTTQTCIYQEQECPQHHATWYQPRTEMSSIPRNLVSTKNIIVTLCTQLDSRYFSVKHIISLTI